MFAQTCSFCLVSFYTDLYRGIDYYIGAKRPSGSATSGPEFNWLDGVPVNITATKSFWVPTKPSSVALKNVVILRDIQRFQWSDAFSVIDRRSFCEQPFLPN